MLPPDLPTTLYALTIALSTYLTLLVFTPPNPSPKDSKVKDRIYLATGTTFLFLRKAFVVLVCTYHLYIVLISTSQPIHFCPNPSNINPKLFSWNLYSGTCFAAIIVAANIRLLAFRQLGPNFTFRLAAPKKLITTGMYKYVQHPSYIANAIVILGNAALFERIDGAVGCLLPTAVVGWGWWKLVGLGFVALGSALGWTRVKDEENMLKGVFGNEWEEYHERTKRFIPGVV